jgi:hypothetical protein
MIMTNRLSLVFGPISVVTCNNSHGDANDKQAFSVVFRPISVVDNTQGDDDDDQQ